MLLGSKSAQFIGQKIGDIHLTDYYMPAQAVYEWPNNSGQYHHLRVQAVTDMGGWVNYLIQMTAAGPGQPNPHWFYAPLAFHGVLRVVDHGAHQNNQNPLMPAFIPVLMQLQLVPMVQPGAPVAYRWGYVVNQSHKVVLSVPDEQLHYYQHNARAGHLVEPLIKLGGTHHIMNELVMIPQLQLARQAL